MMKLDSKSPPKSLRKLIILIGLGLLIIIFAFPFIWMLSYSLRSTELPPPNRLEFFALPFAFENYWIALDRYVPLGRFLLNSLVVVAIAVPLTVITASWAGFVMSQLSRRAQAILFGLCIAWLLVPAPTVWIPRFIFFTKLGWIDSFASLIAPALMGTSPFYVLLTYIAFARISREVYEVARLDGGSPLRIWYSIALPTAVPSVLTVAMLAFAFFWSDYVSPLLYMRTLFNYTLPVGIQLLQQSARSNYPVLMAASVIMIAPIVLLFGFLQRFFLQEQINFVRIVGSTNFNYSLSNVRKDMMKQLILCLVLVCSLVACVPAAPDHEIVLMLSESPEGLAGYQQIIDEFAKVHPDLKVTINNIPDGGDFLKRLAADFAANTPPDLFVINYRRFGQFAIKGALEPLDAYIAQSESITSDSFYPIALEAFRFNGKQYCLPQNLSSLEVYYNKDLFAAANVPLPNENWTWDEFLSTARALTKSEGGKVVQYGLGIDPVTLRLAPFIWAHGGELVDNPNNPTKLTLDSAPAREAFQWFVDLQVKEHVVPSKADEATEKSQSRFQHGTLAMFLQSRAITPELRDTIKDFDWDVAPLPRDNNVASVLHSDGYCLTSSSKDKATAWSFVEFAVGPEGQKIIVTSGRTVPSLKQVAESPLFLDAQIPPANSRVYLDMAPNLRSVPLMSTWVEIEEVLNQEIKRAFYGDASVDEAIHASMNQTQEYFEQNQAELSTATESEEVVMPSTPVTGPILADVVLTEGQNQVATTVKVGQVINVRLAAEAQWMVNYRSEVLTALTPPEQMSQPGSDGWFFQVLAPGSTEIALESRAPSCPDNTPCPPNIRRFVFPIQVAK